MCIEIEERFEIKFLEIGSDYNHVHFLIQSVLILSVKSIVQTIKSITAKELFRLHPVVKRQLWGQFWSSGYFVNTFGQYANEETIQKYISTQGDGSEECGSYHKG